MEVPQIAGGIPSSAVVGVVSSIIVRESIRRKGIVITNLSDTRIDLCRGERAILNSGIPIYPGGGVFIDQVDNVGRIYTGPYSAISSAGAKAVAISEDR